MSKITLYRISYHFRSIPQFLFCEVFLQNGCQRPFWMSENHFRSHFWPFQINTQLFLNFFLQNGCRRPFWMSKNHFGSHFWLFWINTDFFFFYNFTKWLPVTILDVRKSLSISFLAISDRYPTLICFEIFDKMAAVGHFGCPKFTLDHISGHFRSIQIYFYFLQKGCRWPFWMSENHFRSHFYPFHIDTQLFLC